MTRKNSLIVLATLILGIALGSAWSQSPYDPCLDCQKVEYQSHLKMSLPTSDDTQAAREKLATEMLELMDAKTHVEKAFHRATEHMVKDLPSHHKIRMKKVIAKHYKWDSFKDRFLNLYVEVFTLQDLRSINEFYRTEVGQALLKKQPELMERTMATVEKIHQENLPIIAEELQKMEAPEPDLEPELHERERPSTDSL